MNEDKIKRTVKDTAFTTIFKKHKAFVDLYEELSGIRLNEDEIKPFDLDSSILERGRYNDVSFLTDDDKLIVMVEHQSTPNANMQARMLIYYAHLLRVYTEQGKINLYSSSQIELPQPEFYIAYNGKQPYVKEGLEHFKSDFLTVGVKIVDINYENLENRQSKNSLAGYSYFVEMYREAREQKLSDVQVWNYVRGKCAEKGYLIDELDKEGYVMMIDLMTYDEQLIEQGIEEGIKKGLKKGIDQGIEIGIKKGIEKGRADAQSEIDALKAEIAKLKVTQGKDIGNKSPNKTPNKSPGKDVLGFIDNYNAEKKKESNEKPEVRKKNNMDR